MNEILKSLNENPGITGSVVLTVDGIVVASEVTNELDEETTAALAGNIVNQTTRFLEAGRYSGLDRMVLTASRGKIVIENLERLLLVIVTNQFINLDVTNLEIKSAAKSIARIGKIAI